MLTSTDYLDFFVFGLAGAAVYEFVLFITHKLERVKVEDKAIPLKFTIPMFLLVGGVVTLIYQMHFGTAFVEINGWKIFLIGFGWQAIVKSYVPSEKARLAHTEPTMNQALADRVKRLEDQQTGGSKTYIDELKKRRTRKS
jgi:hypothetical protein